MKMGVKSFFSILLLSVFSLVANGQEKLDLRDTYARIDAEMERWPEYVARRQARIDSLRTLLFKEEGSADQQYDLCEALVDEFQCFQNDSAIYYIDMLRGITKWTKDATKPSRTLIKKARQAVRSGMYEAALSYLSEADTTILSKEQKTEFYRVLHFAYMEMSAYCYIWDKRAEYLEKEHQVRQTLLQLLPEGSAEWLLCKSYDELLADRYKEAERLIILCMEKCEPYGDFYRQAAFFRRFICESLKKEEESVYWQAECAISELRLGMTDQIGMWSLAEKMGDKDLSRRYKYIRFSWDAISKFSERNARSWQITPVLSTIEHQYQAEKEQQRRTIITGMVILAILLILLAVAYFYVSRQRTRLAIARQQLQESNNQLEAANSHLSDANRVKEEYIVQLLAYNSDFIDQKEEQRRAESKMLRNGKMAELTKLLNSADKTGKELEQLLTRFDEIFLGLYPTFVNDFNALLSEEGRIKTTKPGQMNTPLRIFALMRLGIDKISDVAKILHCSSQTIYNYRNNLRNAYLGNREKFEEEVRNIGIQVRKK